MFGEQSNDKMIEITELLVYFLLLFIPLSISWVFLLVLLSILIITMDSGFWIPTVSIETFDRKRAQR